MSGYWNSKASEGNEIFSLPVEPGDVLSKLYDIQILYAFTLINKFIHVKRYLFIVIS